MTHVTCRLTAKHWDQLRNPTLGSMGYLYLFYNKITLSSVACPQQHTSYQQHKLLDDYMTFLTYNQWNKISFVQLKSENNWTRRVHIEWSLLNYLLGTAVHKVH